MNTNPEDKIKLNVDLIDVRVLVVDDNASDRMLVKAILNRMGIKNIQEAENGNTAVFKIRNAMGADKYFDLVISDWMMPGKSGFDLLKTIRAEKDLASLGVIMVTSVADSDKVTQSLLVGVEDFVIKPIQPVLLAEKVEKVLLRLKKS